MSLSEVIKTALDQIKYIAKTETIFGEPITAGEVTLIPVSRVSIGFAAGGAENNKNQEGSGTGGGINITPIAFISVHGEHIQVHPLTATDPVLSKILSSAPGLIDKVSKFMNRKNDTEKKE